MNSTGATELNPRTLLVGNFLSSVTGIRSVSEDLGAQLSAAGWPILMTSRQRASLARVTDMLAVVWRRRADYDVAAVEVFSGRAFIWAELVCRGLQALRKPYLLTLHGGNLPNFAAAWPGRVRRLLNSAAAVTTPSRYLLEQLAPYRQDLLLLPNPLQLAAYEFRPRLQAQPKLVWLRAFHAIYNPSLAPRVLAELCAEFPALTLTMIGPDKGDGSAQTMWAMAERLQVAQRIEQSGAVAKAEVPRHLNRGDIFLNTTNVDNTPVSVLEALACGLCIVSTAVGGLPYLLEHERDALLVPPDDPAAMAAAVRRLLTEPELAATLSHNARRKAEQWDWGTILPQWQALLRIACDARPPTVTRPKGGYDGLL